MLDPLAEGLWCTRPHLGDTVVTVVRTAYKKGLHKLIQQGVPRKLAILEASNKMIYASLLTVHLSHLTYRRK